MAASNQHVCTPLDSIWPPVYHSFVFCFPCDSSRRLEIFEVLGKGLAKTFQQRPHLAGILVKKHDKLHLIYPDDVEKTPLPVVMNDLTSESITWSLSYTELHKLAVPFSCLDPDLLELPGGYQKLSRMPLALKANFIPGGCLLVVVLSHAFADLHPMSSTIETLARNCKAAQVDMDTEANRTLLRAANEGRRTSWEMLRHPEALRYDTNLLSPDEKEVILQNRVLWQRLGLQMPPLGSTPPPSDSTRPQERVTAIFVASNETISRLKEDSQPELPKDGTSPVGISSFEAEAALLWKCIIRARKPDLDATLFKSSRLRIPVNVRAPLGIPLGFHGNVFQNSVTELPLEFLAGEVDGRRVAPLVRSALMEARDPVRARDAVKLACYLPDPSLCRPLFSTTTAQDLVMSTWRELTFLKSDWGPLFGPTGRSEFLRFTQGQFRGLCLLLPSRNPNERCVAIDLERMQLERLCSDHEFQKYFDLMPVYNNVVGPRL